MPDDHKPNVQARRGAELTFRPADEFHQCWFPVALSAEVAVGQVIGAPFLDGRVVIYRTSDGAAHVLSAYCRHLGADLSIGKVVDDRLQCPFHYWRYEKGGACVDTAAGDPPPKAAKLHAYPTAESLGLIWAFNGETPLYPVPSFETPESQLVIDAFRNPAAMPVDAPVVFLNAFDIQHFRVVHGLEIDVDPDKVDQTDHGLRYFAQVETPEFGKVVQARRLWGVNTVTIASERGGRTQYLMHSLCPVDQAATIGFVVTAATRDSAAPEALKTEEMQAASREFVLRLINEDAPIFATIRLRKDCLTASDRFLAFGMDYIRRYPTAHPGRNMIS